MEMKMNGCVRVSLFSERKLGVNVINVSVLMKHSHIIYCLTQDSPEGERGCYCNIKGKPELHQEPVTLIYGDIIIVYLKLKL